MVVVVAIPNLWPSCVQRAEVKTDPLSEVMVSGRPNCDIHASMRAETQDLVEASVIGTVSGHIFERSIAVNIYWHP